MTAIDPLRSQLGEHLSILYPDRDLPVLIENLIEAFQDTEHATRSDSPLEPELWTERDCLMITYGDSIVNEDERPLRTLHRFLNEHLRRAINAVHILPFYPFSSDDGFSVIDYTAVRDDLGTWEDVRAIAADYKLMADVVINHASSESDWFQAFLRNEAPYDEYFIQAKFDDDLSQVVRPRATPLLRAVETPDGVRQVWCTFSHDQIDLNFACPELLVEFLKIIAFYLKSGARILRLDAIGYLWKEPGTTCIHLPQTHEFVRLLRTLCDHFAPGTVLITETNVPNHENLTYFGNRNEAHAIYNFSLAPLLVHALLSGTSQYLKRWMMSMPPAPDDCAYLNFTASHDGIGMRPAEGLLSDQEQMELVETIRRHGGRFSTRRAPDGTERIYEVNVSLFEAMKGTVQGEDEHQIARFLASQTIPLGVEGIPAVYIHSLLATPNDTELVAETGRARSINRHRWDEAELCEKLADPESPQAIVKNELLRRIEIRSQQPAFHPNAVQFTLQSPDETFCFWRQSRDRSQSIFAVHNVTAEEQQIALSTLNLIVGETWRDLLTDTPLDLDTGSLTLTPYQCIWLTNT